MKKKVNIHDIKQALLDERFRESLPPELTDDVQKFLKNPGCACNHPIYMSVMRKAGKEIASYFPTKETPTSEEVEKNFERFAKNEWAVINCSIHDLSSELKKLPVGRKQLDIARWEDQITIVINHLEDLY
jgi:hypothetical protein